MPFLRNEYSQNIKYDKFGPRAVYEAFQNWLK